LKAHLNVRTGQWYAEFHFRNADRTKFGVQVFAVLLHHKKLRQMATRVILDDVYRKSLLSDDPEPFANHLIERTDAISRVTRKLSRTTRPRRVAPTAAETVVSIPACAICAAAAASRWAGLPSSTLRKNARQSAILKC
jgi:hypothetical protein